MYTSWKSSTVSCSICLSCALTCTATLSTLPCIITDCRNSSRILNIQPESQTYATYVLKPEHTTSRNLPERSFTWMKKHWTHDELKMHWVGWYFQGSFIYWVITWSQWIHLNSLKMTHVSQDCGLNLDNIVYLLRSYLGNIKHCHSWMHNVWF